jgi:hypothetical protein
MLHTAFHREKSIYHYKNVYVNVTQHSEGVNKVFSKCSCKCYTAFWRISQYRALIELLKCLCECVTQRISQYHYKNVLCEWMLHRILARE